MKDILAEEFNGPSGEHQRLFYMGRELKSGGRTLQKLGLGRQSCNNVLHMHIVHPAKTPPPIANGTKRRRGDAQTTISGSTDGSSNQANGVIEIVDDDNEDEVAILPKDSIPPSQRPRHA